MPVFILSIILALSLFSPAIATADVLKVQAVAKNVFAIVGPLGNRDKDNLGNNATFGLVVTSAGAVLIDAGGTVKGAAQLDAAIRTVTNKPVVAVINTGGQDHRWLGNGYFKDKGATIYASAAAVEDQAERFSQQIQGLEFLVGKKHVDGTGQVQADVTFEERRDLKIGDTVFQLIPAPAHTPGDAIVWLATARVAFSGDLVYVQRLLGIIDVSSLNDWIKSFAVLESLAPEHVVPGHGTPTTLARAQADTRDYLQNLQSGIRRMIANGDDDRAAVNIDQSRWSPLGNFEQLAKRNALAAYFQLEFE